MATAGNIVVNLIANTGKFTKGMKTGKKSLYAMQKEAMVTRKRILRMTAAFAAVGTAVYGIKKLTDAMTAMVKVASDMEEISSKFNVVFRELADEARQWSDDFANSVGRARQDVRKWMSGLQDTFVPLGFARDKSAELSKELVKLAVDVGSFNNVASDTVIRDFTSAIVGNHEAVRKYGIIITETSMKQKALMEGMDPKNLTNLQKVQLRYNTILESTVDAQGDAIRTADSYANQVQRMEANILNLKESIGTQLLPAWTEMVRGFNQRFADESIKEFEAAIVDLGETAAIHLSNINAYWLTLRAGIAEAGAEVYEFMDSLTNLDVLNKKLGLSDWTYEEEAVKLRELADELDARAEQSADKFIKNYRPPNTLPPTITAMQNPAYGRAFMAGGVPDRPVVDINAIKEQQKAMEDMEKFATRTYANTRTAAENYRAEIERLNEALEAGLIDVETYNRAVGQAGEQMAKASEKTEVLNRAALQVGDTFASAFGEAIIQGEELSNVLESLADDLMRIFTNRLVLGPLAGGIDSMIMNFGASAAGGVALGGPSMGGAGTGGVHQFHKGGIVGAFANAPRYHDGFMPGEVPAILKEDEGVFTPEQMKAMGGRGGSANVTFQVQAIDAQSVDQFFRANSKRIAGEVHKQMQTNHPVRRFQR